MRPMWGVEPERGSAGTTFVVTVAFALVLVAAWWRVASLERQLADRPCQPVAGVIVIPTSAPDSTWVADGPTGARFPLKNLREASLALVLRGK